jgi:hypothetical protein
MWFQFANSTTEKTEGSFKYHDHLWWIDRLAQDPERTFGMATFKRTSSYMKPLPTEKRQELAKALLSSFPYNLFRKSLTPLEATVVRPDCFVNFIDKTMTLCVATTTSGFVNNVSIHVVKRLLENHFGCSAEKLPIVKFTERTDNCFLVDFPGQAKASDHVWGNDAKLTNYRYLRKNESPLFMHFLRDLESAASPKRHHQASPTVSLAYPGEFSR